MKHVRHVTRVPKVAQNLGDLLNIGSSSKQYNPFEQLLIVLTKGQAAKLF